MDVDELAAQLARTISQLLYGDDDTVGPATGILADGMLSSINMIELVAAVEERYGTAVPAELLYGPDFATPRALAQLVVRLSDQPGDKDGQR